MQVNYDVARYSYKNKQILVCKLRDQKIAIDFLSLIICSVDSYRIIIESKVIVEYRPSLPGSF